MRRRRRNQGGPAKVIFLTLGVLAGVLALVLIGIVTWIIGIAASAPALSTLKPIPQGATSIVYAADGTRLGFIQSTILRSQVLSTDIPETFKDATVAIEDKRFYKHKGVDFEGIVRAAFKNFQSHNTVQGGSTLTMQLIKNLYEQPALQRGVGRTYKVKIREAKLAEDMENEHPGMPGKQWILVKYVNNVPYGTVGGQTAVGVQAAARVFFDNPSKDLTLAESALLAGLPQAPSRYNPYRNPQTAIARRNQVLGAMAAQGLITPSAAAE